MPAEIEKIILFCFIVITVLIIPLGIVLGAMLWEHLGPEMAQFKKDWADFDHRKACEAIMGGLGRDYWTVRHLAKGMKVSKARAQHELDWLYANGLVSRRWGRRTIRLCLLKRELWRRETPVPTFWTSPDQERRIKARAYGVSSQHVEAVVAASAA